MNKTLKWLGGGIAAAMLLGLAGLFSGEVAEAQPTGPPHRFAGSVTLEGEPAAAGTSVTALVGGAECGSATVITGASGSTYSLDVPADCADAGDTVNFQVGGVAAAEYGMWASGGRTDLDLTATTPEPEMPEVDTGDACPDESMNGMDDGMDDMPDEPAEPMENGMDDEPAEPMENGMDDGMDGMDEGMEDCPDDMGGTGDPEEPTEPDTGTEGDTGTEDETGMTPEAAGPPDTGTGLASTSNTTSLAAILGVMALAITLGGYTFARRRR